MKVWTPAGSPRGVLLSNGESDGSRSMLRHEQMSVAMALAEKLHHSSRGQRMARAGEEDLEMHYTTEFRKHPPLRAAGIAMDVNDVPVASGSHPDPLGGYSGKPWSRSATVRLVCRFTMLLCRTWGAARWEVCSAA